MRGRAFVMRPVTLAALICVIVLGFRLQRTVAVSRRSAPSGPPAAGVDPPGHGDPCLQAALSGSRPSRRGVPPSPAIRDSFWTPADLRRPDGGQRPSGPDAAPYCARAGHRTLTVDSCVIRQGREGVHRPRDPAVRHS